MSKDLATHAIALELKEPVAKEVDAGANVSIALTVACHSGCDLSGAPFKVMESDDVFVTGELPGFTKDDRRTVEITVTAPEQIGEFEWAFVVPAHEIDGIVHEQACVTFSFKTNPHATSLAVWDNPSPVVIGEKFRLKVGAKCTAACALTGKDIEIHDETGAIVARGALGETAWRGTTALYWTLVEMTAPADKGSFCWSVEFSAADLRLPHGGASCAFSFVTVMPPEHSVSVKVVEKETETPIHDAHVRLGVYRTSTDETGLARFAVPAGEHRLFIWKAGYEAPARTIKVNKSENVQVEAAVLPVENPDAYWQG